MSSINSRVPPSRIAAIDSPSDGEVAAYQASSGQFEWVGQSSGGTPGGSNNEIQFNNSGAFGGDAGFLMNVKGDGATTKIRVGNILVGANLGVGTAATNGTVYIQSDGSGQIFLTSGSDSGGTFADTIVNVNCNGGSDNSILRFRDNSSTKEANIKLDGTSNLDIDNENTDKNIELSVKGTGSIEIKNTTTNSASTLIVRGNGTGIPTINLTNDTKAVTIKCDESQKLKVAGGSSSFIFDASGANTGITWPDGTTQITAASGGGGLVGVLPQLSTTAETLYNIGTSPPWGIAGNDTNVNMNTMTQPFAFPFIAPETGTVSAIGVQVNTSNAQNAYVAIYDNGSDNLPDSRLGYATISLSSTGEIFQTSITGTISLTAGTQYWYSINSSVFGAGQLNGTSATDGMPNLGIASTMIENSTAVKDNTASANAVPPSSFTTSFGYPNWNRAHVGLKF